MKIVQVSDIHIHPGTILGHDPVENARAAFRHIATEQSDADLVVFSGDLAHFGDPDSYARLKSLVEECGLTGTLSPRLMMGNHDDRDAFKAAFPQVPHDAAGFVQYVEETPAGHFVYMDSVDNGRHPGLYCDARCDWLETVLERAVKANERAFLFMHHNPVRVFVANADIIGMRDAARFHAILERYHTTIAHIFFGHCHYTLSGSVNGIPFSAPRSTCHVCWPDFDGPMTRMGHGPLTPSYSVIFVEGRDIVVHTIDFLDRPKVLWAHEG